MPSSRAITLATLRTRVRQRADMENSTFISDTELTTYVNSAADVLYDLLISSYGPEYWLTTSTIPFVSGTSEYDMPGDFYKLLGVEALSGGQYYSLRTFQWEERSGMRNASSYYAFSVAQYRLKGASTDSGVSRIEIMPPTADMTSFDVHYIPYRTLLANDADALNGFQGWEEIIVLQAAIKCLNKEESDSRALQAELQEQLTLLKSMKHERDSRGQERVVDVGDFGGPWWF